MSLLTSQMTPKMSTTSYSGLSALIQAATSQLGDLAAAEAETETNTSETNDDSPEAEGLRSRSHSPPTMLSNPTTPTPTPTPTLEDAELDLDGTSTSTSTSSSWHHQRGSYTAATNTAITITPLLTAINQGQPGVAAKFLFPEVLMCLLVNPAYEDIVTFLPDGKYFAIRRVDFTNLLLYKHFYLTSFEAFLDLTRGWGFIRVNGNINEDQGTNNNRNTNNNRSTNTNTNNGTTCNESSINTNNNNTNSNSNSNIKTDIYVFRHPHFVKNQPIDMNKIRLNRKHSRSSTGNEVPPRIILEKAVSEGSHTSNNNDNNTINSSNCNHTNKRQRQLAQSSDVNNRGDDSEDCSNHHRLRSSKSRGPPLPSSVDDVEDPLSLSGSSCSCDHQPAQQQQQLRLRSSLELRGVAQAITASKLHLNSSELINETDNCCYENNNNNSNSNSNSNDRDSPMLNNNNNKNDSSTCHSPPQLERRQSTTSSLVDGGVETATHNIVTDAIEALLFDESHTRETYNRHEKELSVSSLPGVVPISKQLFSASKSKNKNKSKNSSSNNKDGAISETTSGDGGKKSKRKSKGRARKATTPKPQSSSSSSSTSSSSSWAIHTTIGSLEDASRNNGGSGSSSSFSNNINNNNLRVIIPSSDDGEMQRRGSYGSMVVSPARMEAAAALVSQSRNRNDEEL